MKLPRTLNSIQIVKENGRWVHYRDGKKYIFHIVSVVDDAMSETAYGRNENRVKHHNIFDNQEDYNG